MSRIPAVIGPAIAGAALLAAITALAVPAAHAAVPAEPPASGLQQLAKACEGKDGWADPAPPAGIADQTWYVGTCGISAVLVTGPQGHVLIDGGVAEAAPLVLANIRRLGFAPEDVRWIVASHEHWDHVGARAALQRATGAKVAATAPQAAILRSGMPSPADPQYAIAKPFEPVRVDRVLADGDSLVVGSLVLTAHATPAHAPGSTSWTWQSCTAGFTCRMVAYADSATTISADDYRFTDHPERIAQVRQGLAAIAALPCDVLLTPHPGASRMMERFAGDGPLADAAACRAYAAAATDRFDARLAEERAKPRP